MHISAVSVIKLNKDVVTVKIRPNNGARMKVAELTAPVNTNPSTTGQLVNSTRADFKDLNIIIL